MRRSPLLTLLVACGTPPAPPSADGANGAGAPAAEAVAAPERPTVELSPLAEPPPEAGPTEAGASPWTGARAARADGPGLVVLMVLDTVRADHTSLCGYERPTTPWLAGLARKGKGVSVGCDVYTPGAWTIPSHASYFTGLSVPEHGVDAAGAGLPADLPTLAEEMARRGWQTLAVSANPTLGSANGLLRGFDRWTVARNLTSLRGDALVEAVRTALGQMDPDRPLFLFVNVLDAHDPWPAVPPGLDWVPAQRGLGLDVHDEDQQGPYHRFVRGELTREDAATYARRITDVYDHGVAVADRTANRIVGMLAQEGWTQEGWRLVLTSDHGEYLGEHGLLRHGCYPWEPVVRVPLVVVDTTRTPPPLEGPLSARQVHALVRTGALADDVEVASFTRRRIVDPKMGADTVALWPAPGEKLLWFEGRWLRYDLTADPGEMGREELGEHPERARLERWVEAHRGHLAERGAVDRAQVEVLRGLGYVE